MSDDTQPLGQTPGSPPGDASGRKTARGAVRWLGIALVLSVAVNLLFVGYAGTRAYHFRHARSHAGGDIGVAMHEGRRFVRDLPSERRHELVALFRGYRDEFRSQRDEVDKSVRALVEVLRSEAFDRETLEAAVATVQGHVEGLVARGSDVTVEILMALSDQERRDFADRLIERLP